MPFGPAEIEIENRASTLAYEDLGPGLYDDETLYRLDTGDLVAASIRTDRCQMSNGLVFKAWVRVVDETGQTRVDTAGNELELEHHHTAPPGVLAQRAAADIARDLLRIMLGEDPATHDVDGEDMPWIALSDEVIASINVRQAISVANGNSGSLDVSDILA